MAGGSNKKKFNKPKTRKPNKPSSLFVEGGLLSDWSPVINSPLSRGKSKNSNNNGNNLTASKNKSGVRFEIGSSSGGKSKGSNSNSRVLGSQKPKMNAFAFKYPQVSPLADEGVDRHNKLDESNPIVLVDSKESKIIAYIDQTPVTDSETVKYTYDYGASFETGDSSHRGLGFYDESEENPGFIESTPVTENKQSSRFDSSSSDDMETDIMNDDASSSPEKNAGFLSIGSMKLYTHDISYDEDDEDDDDDDDDDNESLDSSESEDSSDSDGLYNNSASEIDDAIAKDYFEGIGGSYKVANVDQLVGKVFDNSDDGNDDIHGGCFNETVKRLGGIALQDASREYGMKKPRSRKINQAKNSELDDWSAIDDLMLVKNPRSLYGKKKNTAKIPQSWPSRAEKSKNFKRFSGEKKKRRQDMIAFKRRERMINRGVDLDQINLKLEQMVQNGGDIISFQLTHSRDCSQVQRLAAIYRLRSGSQGSGKRRIVTVIRTEHTGMPSSNDRVRLEKLLRVTDEVENITSGKTGSTRTKKGSRAPTVSSPLDPKPTKSKTSEESSKKKRRERDKTGSYAAQPVSFISSGTMVPEPVMNQNPTDQTLTADNKPVTNSLSYGAFEMHTTGFGSRMMAKMGYIDGGGLGKDGRGISEPIEAIQRPKSLGLGAKIPEISHTSEITNLTPPQRITRSVGQGSRGSENRGKSGNVQSGSESRGKSGNMQFGSFEKHTKGFGSKMMAKMGFIEGTGLGQDSQGMVNPLVASRLPKSRGLGAKG